MEHLLFGVLLSYMGGGFMYALLTGEIRISPVNKGLRFITNVGDYCNTVIGKNCFDVYRDSPHYIVKNEAYDRYGRRLYDPRIKAIYEIEEIER